MAYCENQKEQDKVKRKRVSVGMVNGIICVQCERSRDTQREKR